MKRVALALFLILSFVGFGLTRLAQPVSAQAVIFASAEPTAPDPLTVDCSAGSMPSLSIFMPLAINRDDPSGIRVVGAPQMFRNKRVWFFLTQRLPTTNPLGPPQFSFPVTIDGNGNADLSQQTLGQIAPSIPEGDFSFSVRGGPITTSDFNTVYPICFAQTEYSVAVSGGSDCLNLGEQCTPGSPLKLCNPNSYCDATQTPAVIRLPQLKQPILNNAKCEYVSTPANITCSQANPVLAVSCGSEISAVVGGNSGSGVQVGEQTMCCESQAECGKAQGVESSGEITQVPFNACRQISVPEGNGSAARAETQNQNRDACCKCMTGDQSSFFIASQQRCAGEAENDLDPGTAAKRGIYTAVGCIPSNPEGIITRLVRIGLGLAGGVALLMILAGGFMLTTSQGDPKRVNEAKELVTSAVMGIIFILFSVTILQFIGVTILQIPGFGS